MKVFNIFIPFFDWLYILQLLEYRSGDFWKWIFHNYTKRNLQRKKKLVWTGKIWAIFILSFSIFSFNLGLTEILVVEYFKANLLAQILILLICLQISFFYIWTANFILQPIDEVMKIIYLNQAQGILEKHPKLMVIGITGSYGKTSMKNILQQILETKYKVLATPSSFNTDLGIAKIIKKSLQKNHEIFIVEMGAYKKGEIRKICKLVKPQMAIITGINEQHLDRFKKMENIMAAKTEIIDCLPKNGTVFLNADNKYLQKYFEENFTKLQNMKIISYGIYTEDRNNTISEINFIEDNLETEFFWDKYQLKLKTKLLGEHNLLNLVGALEIAKKLKINPKDFQSILARIKAVPHRMEIVPTENGVLVIDDAYSANPDGFEAAMKTISQFEKHRRIVVTPGIIELGSKEMEIHEKIGEEMGKKCEVIILIGKARKHKRIKSLIQGIEKTNFNRENLFVVKSLEEGQKKIAEIVKIGDLILFENDLPDQY